MIYLTFTKLGNDNNKNKGTVNKEIKMTKLATITFSIATSLPFILLSQSALACDDKACEKAYLSSTSQYVSNHGRQAVTARTEREAHALNRERRDYAVQNHLVLTSYYSSKSRN